MHKVIQHHFGGGVYCKHVEIPENARIVSHKHQFDHLSILANGCVIVETDETQETYYAPAVIEIKAEVHHAVTAVNGPATWMCIHATNETDETKVDEILIMSGSV